MSTLVDIGTMIVQSSGIGGGKPRIAGTGVTIHRIVSWYKMGFSPEEIADRIGHLTLAQVHAALAYYHANRDEIETEILSEEQEANKIEKEHHLSSS